MTKKICSVDGCDNKTNSKGFCKMHYNRFVRHGDPNYTKYREVCTISGCNKKHVANGYCGMHNLRFRKYGDPNITKTRIRNECKIDGCTKISYKNGMCTYHSYRNDKYNNPEYSCRDLDMHGMSRTNEYKIYIDMKMRCLNENHKSYLRYGGRGISICERWKASFPDFLSDMGTRPTGKHQIDRIDNDGNYEPDNCRWVLPIENTRNSSQSKITIKIAREIRALYKTGGYTQKQIGDIYGIHHSTVGFVTSNRTWKERTNVTE